MLNGNQQIVNTMTMATIILIIQSWLVFFTPMDKEKKREEENENGKIESYVTQMMYARLLMEQFDTYSYAMLCYAIYIYFVAFVNFFYSRLFFLFISLLLLLFAAFKCAKKNRIFFSSSIHTVSVLKRKSKVG